MADVKAVVDPALAEQVQYAGRGCRRLPARRGC